MQGDLLAPLPEPVDLIVANLPYIDHVSDDAMPAVVAYKPHEALFSTNHGLEHIFRLLEKAHAYLRPQGIIALEFDYDQPEAIDQQIKVCMPHAAAAFGKDYAGWDRYVVIKCK